MFKEDIGFILMVYVFAIIAIGLIAFALYKVIHLICKAIIANTKIKYFGSSQEYEAFKKWRKEQVVDTEEL